MKDKYQITHDSDKKYAFIMHTNNGIYQIQKDTWSSICLHTTRHLSEGIGWDEMYVSTNGNKWNKTDQHGFDRDRESQRI